MEPKLTKQTIAILAVLLHDPSLPRYGLGVAADAEVRVTTVYDTLLRLEESGWLTSEWETGAPSQLERPRRRLYRLTALGETSAQSAVHGEIAKLQRSLPTPDSPRRRASRPLPSGEVR